MARTSRINIKSGTIGWVALSAFVVGWDYWAGSYDGETLSSAFGRATRHPIARWPVLAAWTVTTLHLFGRIPQRVDPYLLVAGLARRT